MGTEPKIDQKREKFDPPNKESEVIKRDSSPSNTTSIHQERRNGESSSLSSHVGVDQDAPKKSSSYATASKLKINELKPSAVTLDEDLDGKNLKKHRHNLRPQRS